MGPYSTSILVIDDRIDVIQLFSRMQLDLDCCVDVAGPEKAESRFYEKDFHMVFVGDHITTPRIIDMVGLTRLVIMLRPGESRYAPLRATCTQVPTSVESLKKVLLHLGVKEIQGVPGESSLTALYGSNS